MATKEEGLITRLLFKCRAILANARAFQDLFWDVMKAKHGDEFATVAPQGRKGDGGNDGYLPRAKHYYQVFAPIDPKAKVMVAVKKLGVDFEKVVKQWAQKNGGLDKFSYAFNDKYEGAPKDIELALQDLRRAHSPISFAQYCCRELESDFMGLPDTEWDRIVSMNIPASSRVTGMDYSVLGEVIRFVMSADVSDSQTRLDLPPELDEKINLNGLSKANGVRIRSGALLTGHIEKYIKGNSAFALTALRDHMVGHYETAKKVIEKNAPAPVGSKGDAVFDLFRRSLFPRGGATVAAVTAVDAVIGYFFEACDVFDPRVSKGDPGASP